jgi:arsenate reductase
MSGKPRVLFLCTGNSARSQMAEALLRQYAGDHFEVYSAGLEPKGLNPFAKQVMEENGIDMSAHASKHVKIYLGRVVFATVITLCSDAEKNCPIFPGITQRLHWPFDDPAAETGADAEKLSKFRRVRDQIDAKIRDWLAEQGIPAQQMPSRTV